MSRRRPRHLSLVAGAVSVGGGLRYGDDQVELLERVVNVIRGHAPDAAIAFNSTLETTYEAASRWLR